MILKIFMLMLTQEVDNQNLAASPHGSKEWEVFLRDRVSTRAVTSMSLPGTSAPAITKIGSLIQTSVSVPTDLDISGVGKMTNSSTLSATDAVSVRSSIISGEKQSMRDQGEMNGSESLSISSKTHSHKPWHMRALVSKFSLLR